MVCLVMGFRAGRLSAQTTGNSVIIVNLISNVLQITVNTNAINLGFATSANYINGVTSTVSNQITVTSNSAYSVFVRAAGLNMVNGVLVTSEYSP